jgi:hypothetical protein
MNESDIHIRYLDREEIDIKKWDGCIVGAPNGLIYAFSFYLDMMAKNWSALVVNDYEAVIPLTWNRKYGIKYLYQPAFTAQLGLFSKHPADQNILEKCIDLSKSHFRYCEIHLNAGNPSTGIPVRANYVLNLERIYSDISKGYQKRMADHLKKSSAGGMKYTISKDYLSVISLFKSIYGDRLPKIRLSDYTHFESLCRDLVTKEMILVREVRNDKNELMSANIFFRDDKRIYNIMPVTPAAGREQRAQFYLLDQLIREFATNKLLLDFEGSEVPGIAAFYRKFGSVNQPYPFLKFNHLPFPLRYFK